MKGLKKLTLASAIIAASSSAFAMQAMDDESLSTATGQAGLTISLDTDITNIDLFWRDADGLGSSSGFSSAGTVLISGLAVNGNDTVINIDAGSNGSGASVLNVGINIPSLSLDIGKIYVGDGTLYDNGTVPTSGAVLAIDNTLTITGLNTTLQLGNGASHLLAMTGTLGTVTLGGLTISDVAHGGDIVLGTTTISGVVLTGTTVDVQSGGLVINSGAQTGVQVEIASLKLGSAASASIGEVKLANIASAANTITVTGH